MRRKTDSRRKTRTSGPPEAIVPGWIVRLTEAIKTEQSHCAENSRRVNGEPLVGWRKYRALLWQLPSAELAELTVRRTLRCCLRETEPTVASVLTDLGKDWDASEEKKLHLAARLVQLLMETARVQEDGRARPAFAHHSEVWNPSRNKKKYGHLWLTRAGAEALGSRWVAAGALTPEDLPALAPPALTTDVVKRSPHHNSADISSAPLVPLAVQALGEVKWRVNPDMLKVATALWRRRGRQNIGQMPKRLTEQEMKKERDRWWKSDGRVSDHILFERMLAVAEKYAGKTIYFAHKIDFRGRAYPTALYLNHQGNDVCRALLEFADPKPLSERGRFWLKVHVANFCEQDKLPFENRIKWVEDHLPMLRRWAKNPIRYVAEWGKRDKPFEAIAGAMALFNAGHGSRLPVQMDASNNVLQHYALTLRDHSVAVYTNLISRKEAKLSKGPVLVKPIRRTADWQFAVQREITIQEPFDFYATVVEVVDTIYRCLSRQIGAILLPQEPSTMEGGAWWEVYGDPNDTCTIFWPRRHVIRRGNSVQETLYWSPTKIKRSASVIGNPDNISVLLALPDPAPLQACFPLQQVPPLFGWEEWRPPERVALDARLPAGITADDLRRWNLTSDRRRCRKIIKQAVMTLFYSATKEGAFKQIANGLRGAGVPYSRREWPKICDLLQSLTRAAASSIAPTTFRGMSWLRGCAERIAESNQEVCWTTPMGMVVRQRYRRRPRAKTFRTCLQKIVLLPHWTEDMPVDARKQAFAFAPNFVHSLDAAHMMRTALECNKRNISFAAVHDCYWCHAPDVDRMRTILIEALESVHQDNQLGHLHKEMRDRYPSISFRDSISLTRRGGSFPSIRASVYFCS